MGLVEWDGTKGLRAVGCGSVDCGVVCWAGGNSGRGRWERFEICELLVRAVVGGNVAKRSGGGIWWWDVTCLKLETLILCRKDEEEEEKERNGQELQVGFGSGGLYFDRKASSEEEVCG